MASTNSTPPLFKVLYHLHPDLDTLDFTGPYEIFSHAIHLSTLNSPNAPSKIFQNTITSSTELTTSNQNLALQRHISLTEAYATLAEYDVLVIPGGGTPGVLADRAEPILLIAAFAALPKLGDGKVRTLMTICTGALFAAEAGVLNGLTATTHPVGYEQLREITARKGKTDVLEVRYVVNKVDEEKGLRVITSGGISCGMDSSLWLIGDLVGTESRDKVAETLQYAQREEGIVL